MKTTITCKQLELTDAIRAYIDRRAEKLPKFWDRVRETGVVLEKRGGHTYFVEFIARADGHDPFVATEKHDDLYAAIDESASKLERQVRTYHGKLVEHKP